MHRKLALNENETGGQLSEGQRLLDEGAHRKALAIFEGILEARPDQQTARLGAAEACLLIGWLDRAAIHMTETPPVAPPADRDRWAILRAESLRRTGSGDQAIDFIDRWLPDVAQESKGRLLWRKAAILVASKKEKEAASAIAGAWEAGPRENRAFLLSVGTFAYFSGEFRVQKEAALRLARTGLPVAGAYLLGLAYVASWSPWLLRLPIAFLLAFSLLLPIGRYVYFAMLFVLGIGWLSGWRNNLYPVRRVCGSFLLYYTALYGVIMALRTPHGWVWVGAALVAGLIGAFALRRLRRPRPTS